MENSIEPLALPVGIRQRGESYFIDVTVKGVRRTATAPDLNSAIIRQSELKLELLKQMGNPVTGEKNEWTLAQAFDATCNLRWNVEESKSWKKLQQNGENVLRHFGKATLLSSITSERIDSFAQLMKESGLSGGTVNRQLSALSKMLSVAMDKRRLAHRPKIYRKRESPGRIRFITEEEEALILQTFQLWGMSEQAEIVQVLVDTGLRPSELWRLEKRDLDFASDLIHIWTSKNDKPRSIPMVSRVRNILHKRATILREPLVFPYNNYWFERHWDKMKQHLHMEKDKEFIPYCLRHTCCTRLVQRGVPLSNAQVWMGHKTILTTRRYAQFSPDDLRRAAQVLEKPFAVC